jgi:hypothetical protein
MAVKTTSDDNFNVVARKGSKLNQLVAVSQKIIGDEVATRTLLASESGAMCLFDVAAGTVYTLPTIDRSEQIGMTFEFFTNVAVTSNAAKVITGAATEFLLGSVLMGDQTIATSGDVFEANGSSHVAISMDGATKGGLLGTRFVVTAISLTQWAIHGVLQGAGSLATPFATS